MSRVLGRTMRLLGLALAGLALSACASREARLSRSKAFQTYPPDVQEKIKKGRVEVGFSEEMVRLSLGDPHRKYTRTTEKGDQKVWAYTDSRPRSGVGYSVGYGVGSGGSGWGGAVGVGTPSHETYERLRIVFHGGQVVSIEQAEK